MINLNEILTGFNFKTLIPTRFSDMDMFGHANNAVYLTYFEQARSDYWRDILNWDWKTHGIVIVKSEVEYLHPIMLEDKISIYVRTSKVGNSSFEINYVIVSDNNGEETLKTIGKTKQVVIDYSTKKPTAIPKEAREKMVIFDNPEI